MVIDYNDLRKASSPNGLMDLLDTLGHEPISDWDGLVDIRPVILEDNIPPSIRSSVADDAITIRELTSLVGEQKGIECYAAILRPGLKLSSSVCRNLSHAFRNVSSITRIDETFLFIGVPDEKNTGLIDGEVTISQWATIHLSRVYRKAGSSEELRLSRLDWTPTKMSRHTLDCLKALRVNALPGQVDDSEVNRFKEDVKEWFNKEKLSSRFFKEFYKRFEFALDLVQRKARLENYEQFQPTKSKPITRYTKNDRESDPNRQNAGKFMLKQILRLLFLHYLQEKEWLCRDKHFFINQWRNYEKKTRSLPNYDATTATGFHSEVLIPLFFETLNRRRPDDASDNWGETRWDRGDRSKMPYLNGGIFEIDRTHDHFDLESNTAMFLIPDAVFSADRDYDPKLDDETLVGRQVNLLAFLDDYHFTIAEDTPVDEAVALDPELMGKIFENLLVSRHSDGAYYTPRSIVRFQCQDTLARYLEEQLVDVGDLDHDWFLTLFDLDRDFSTQGPTWNEEKFSSIVADRIEAALSECKILDPAVGSGAYLLGMLTEILRLRQVCHKVRTGHMVDRGSVEFYRWKSEIIRESLYGVDINPEAVAICHLRLWLSMVVDQNRESTSPLPNLLFQITAGDSLRDSINGHKIFVPPGDNRQSTLWSNHAGVDEAEPNDEPIRARLKQITKLRSAHFNPNILPSERARTSLEIQTLRIEMMLEGLNQLEAYELKQVNKHRISPARKNKVQNDIIAKFNTTRKRIKEGSFTSIFSYEAIFGEVFERNGRQGFDIVIGNPPYLEDEGKGGYDDIQKLLDLTSNNLYAMFWIRSIRDLARPGGQVSFITSDSFLTIHSHVDTRKILFKESQIHYAIQAGNWFFTFNNAWTAILTVTVRDNVLTDKNASEISENLVAYDISKLPSKDLAALENALARWKPNQTNKARTTTINSCITEEGDSSTWFLKLGSGGVCRIGRYCYPAGLPWRNKNIPIFHACPKIFKLTWDNLEWTRTIKAQIQEPNKPFTKKDTIPISSIEFNGDKVHLFRIGEVVEGKVGIQTSDDEYFIRKKEGFPGNFPIVESSKIISNEELDEVVRNDALRKHIVKNGIADGQFGGRTLVPFAKPTPSKGNLLSLFHCDHGYYIDWSEQSVHMLWNFSIADARRRKNPEYKGSDKENTTKSAVVRNYSHYFKHGVHYTTSGENAPLFWRPWGGIPNQSAPVLFSDYVNPDQILSILSNHLSVMLIKGYSGSLAHSVTNDILNCAALLDIDNYPEIIDLANKSKQNKGIDRFDEQFKQFSIQIMKLYNLSLEDISQVFNWSERRFSRPGVIE